LQCQLYWGIITELRAIGRILVPIEKKQTEIDHFTSVLNQAIIPIQKNSVLKDIISQMVSNGIVLIEFRTIGCDPFCSSSGTENP